jgi:tetratricopeptide (TPR) repeat protein
MLEPGNIFDVVWSTLRSDSDEGRILRRRVLATAALCVFFLTLMIAVGLVAVALTLVVVAAVVALLLAVGVALRRHPEHLASARTAAVRAAGGAKTQASGAAAFVRRPETRYAVARVAKDARAQASRVAASIPRDETRQTITRLTESAKAHASRAATNLRPADPEPDPHREATRLNAAGTQLRREGAYAEAADQHRRALAILQEVGDDHAAALTLNNLALVLDRTGDDAALDMFEEAATTLGSLGDEQGEGQVIANLAVALRRRGNSDRSAEVLELALQKLDEDSPEYRKVEELRRAS